MINYFISMAFFGIIGGIIGLLGAAIKGCDKKQHLLYSLFMAYIGALAAFALVSKPLSNIGGINIIPFAELITNIERDNWYYVLQIIVNIFMFIPMGAFLFLTGKTGKQICFTSLLFSFGIEITELVLKRGVFDIDDLIMNTLGAMIGFLVARKVLEPPTTKRLVLAFFAFVILACVTAVGAYRYNSHVQDEMNRKAMIIWTPEKIVSVDGYDPEYTYSLKDEKGIYVFTADSEDPKLYVTLETDCGKIKINGEGEIYDQFSDIYKWSTGWETMEAVDPGIYEYRNCYYAGKYMVTFINKDTVLMQQDLNSRITLFFERK